MLTRVVAALVALPILFFVVYGTPAVAIPAAIALLCAVAMYEALWRTGFLKDYPRLVAYAIAVAAAIPFWVYAGCPFRYFQMGMLAYVTVLCGENMASHNTITLERLGGSFFLAVFIPYFFSSFVWLRAMEGWRFYILFPFLAAFLCDTCAYFAGRFFGRHKLAPVLSPKKTVEGSIGGLAGAALGMVLYGMYAAGPFGVTGVRLPLMALYGVLGGAISQVGDLSFSCIKREFGIKDYGNLMPGHGGVLDRFDSVIFCAPLMVALLSFLPVAG